MGSGGVYSSILGAEDMLKELGSPIEVVTEKAGGFAESAIITFGTE